MQKKILIFLGLISLGISSLAFGSGTNVTDNYIQTNTVNATTVNISGSCSACGDFENSYSNYNTVLLNTTVTGTTVQALTDLAINDNGYILISGDVNALLISPTGTIIVNNNPSNQAIYYQQITQSITGEYQIIPDSTQNVMKIYKNNVFLQSLGLKINNFSTTGTQNLNVGISPNGKYIIVGGQDFSSSNLRIVIFQGS